MSSDEADVVQSTAVGPAPVESVLGPAAPYFPDRVVVPGFCGDKKNIGMVLHSWQDLIGDEIRRCETFFELSRGCME